MPATSPCTQSEHDDGDTRSASARSAARRVSPAGLHGCASRLLRVAECTTRRTRSVRPPVIRTCAATFIQLVLRLNSDVSDIDRDLPRALHPSWRASD